MWKKTVKTWAERVLGVGVLLYPLVAHISLYYDNRELVVVYLTGLLFLYLLSVKKPLGVFIAVLAIGLLVLLMAGVITSDNTNYLIYVPPILVPAWLATVFLASLSSVNGPVVTRIATLIEGKALDEKQLTYTRVVTLLWGIALLLIAVEALLLSVFAPFIVWSWWAHIGNYLILLSLFVIEALARWLLLKKKPNFLRMASLIRNRSWGVRE